LGVALCDLIGPQPFPLPQENLSELRHRSGLVSNRLADKLRRFEGALQVTGIEARQPAGRQPLAEPDRLAASALRKRGIELPLDTPFVVPRRLAMTYEKKAGGGGFGRLRNRFAGLGLLRARGFDLAIYTNFS
jgi:hypothetical protein